jgi:hypothetical protein
MSICKDCLPVFYKADEIPPQQIAPHALVLRHVELCPLHAAAADLYECVRFLNVTAGSDPAQRDIADITAKALNKAKAAGRL